MKLITFKGREIEVTREQAEKIVDSGQTNLIKITVGNTTEFVNANDIAGIYTSNSPTVTDDKQIPLYTENRRAPADSDSFKKFKTKRQSLGL